MKNQLDIIIPVFNEEDNIAETLNGLKREIKLKFQVIIVYDYDQDPTLRIIRDEINNSNIIILKNKYKSFNGAVKTAFEYSNAEAVVLYTAEDHQNFNVVNKMFTKFTEGYDVVCASRLTAEGDYHLANEPLIKQTLVKIVSNTLIKLTKVGTSDPTNGFRLFSNKIIKNIPIKSKYGFTFAIELLAKAYALGHKICEVPSKSPIRKKGVSKFKYSSIIFYLPWFIHLLLFKPKKNN